MFRYFLIASFILSAPAPSLAQKRAKPPKTTKNNRCKADSDCVLLPRRRPDQCDCPKCGVVWRQAVNKKTHAELKRKWSVLGPCAPTRPCPSCRTIYRGLISVCSKGRCVAQHPPVQHLDKVKNALKVRGVYSATLVWQRERWRPKEYLPGKNPVRFIWLDLKNYVPHRKTRYRVVFHLQKATTHVGKSSGRETHYACRIVYIRRSTRRGSK